MKSITLFSRIIFLVLSFTVLLLTGCGSDSTSPGTAFTATQVSGKSFAYSSSSGSTGTLAFNADGTWSATIGASAFSGTWSINSNGKLVCVTTAGGNHTITYTLLTTTTNSINASAVEVNPSDAANPSNYTATLTAVFTPGNVSGKTFAYSSAGSTGTLSFNADGTWSATIGASAFSGTWSIDSNGKLVCVTTTGGNHTITFTMLINYAANYINTSVVEVNPSDPANPAKYTAMLTAIFTANQISGKTFAYSSAGSTGTLAFNADGTWSATIGASTFSGTWSIDSNGRLVCVTTTGGNHTITFTPLVNNTTTYIDTSVVEVNPSAPNNPANYTATLTPL